MKSLSRKVIILIFILSTFHVQVFGQLDDTCFTITGYYSPLKNQSRYNTKSYEGDIRLNGGGIAGASGRDVFVGMLAAPRNYPFGTKLYFEGLGVGVVEDRGGAIVSKSHGKNKTGCDRIDVWMGYGDAGLNRALRWGKRMVYGTIVSRNTPISLEFKNTVLESYLDLKITPESTKDDIKKLQQLFLSLELYDGEIDGKYGTIEPTLLRYQKRVGLINDNEDWGAGYFGVKTLSKLMADYGGIFKEKNGLPEFKVKYDFSGFTKLEINPDSNSSDIMVLQKIFKDLGLYDGKIDGIYMSIKPSLINYQKHANIVSNNDEWGAGHFGKKTLFALESEFGIEVISSDLEKTFGLSLQNRSQLILLSKKIARVLEQKSKGNKNLKNKYRIKIKNKIGKFIGNLNDDNKKNKLRFLEVRI